MCCELGDTKRVSDISKQPGVPVAMGLDQIRYSVTYAAALLRYF